MNDIRPLRDYPKPVPPPPQSVIEQRLARIEAKVDAILKMLAANGEPVRSSLWHPR